MIPPPSFVLAGLAFVATLAGHFTLTRLGLKIAILNDVRVLLFSAVLMAYALESKAAGPRPRSRAKARVLHPLLVLLAYQFLSAAWAPRNAILADVLSDLVAMAVLLTVYANLAEWNSTRVLTVTFAFLYGAATLYFLYAAAGLGHTASGRWAAFGGGPNVYVRVEALGVLAAAYFYYRSGGKLRWLTGVPPFLVGAMASGSRGGLAALGIATAVALPSLWPTIRSRRFVKAVVALGVLVAATWAFVGQTIIDLTQNRFFATTLQQRYTSDRDVLYEKGVEVFLERPVLGSGVHGFYAITNLGPGERYVHNLPLAMAAEGGAVGLLLFLVALYALRREYARTPRHERSLESRAAAYCGIFILGASLFSGDYYDARLMWILFLLAAIPPAATVRAATADHQQTGARPG
jgi:O-antigen ligase